MFARSSFGTENPAGILQTPHSQNVNMFRPVNVKADYLNLPPPFGKSIVFDVTLNVDVAEGTLLAESLRLLANEAEPLGGVETPEKTKQIIPKILRNKRESDLEAQHSNDPIKETHSSKPTPLKERNMIFLEQSCQFVNIKPELIEFIRSIFFGQDAFDRAVQYFQPLPGDEIAIKNIIYVSFCKGKNKRMRKKLIEILDLPIEDFFHSIQQYQILENCRQKRSISGLLSVMPLVLRKIGAPKLRLIVDGFVGTDRLSETKIRETLTKPEISARIERLIENQQELKQYIVKNFNYYFDKRIFRWLKEINDSAAEKLEKGWKTNWGAKMRLTLAPMDSDRVIKNLESIFFGKKLAKADENKSLSLEQSG